MRFYTAAAIACAATVAGCATDSTGLTTSAIDPKTAPAATTSAAKVDPACVTLVAQIDQLRKEGVVDRAQAVASKGKSSTVNVKRDSLAKLTELDRINAEYQAKCSTISPSATTAQVVAPQPAKTTP